MHPIFLPAQTPIRAKLCFHKPTRVNISSQKNCSTLGLGFSMFIYNGIVNSLSQQLFPYPTVQLNGRVIFIGPRSDHCLASSVTQSIIMSITLCFANQVEICTRFANFVTLGCQSCYMGWGCQN